MPITENRPFIAFVVIVSLAFAWVVSPFYGSILWAVVAAIIFAPLNRRIAGAIPRQSSVPGLMISRAPILSNLSINSCLSMAGPFLDASVGWRHVEEIKQYEERWMSDCFS